jgi:hypothetical protein
MKAGRPLEHNWSALGPELYDKMSVYVVTPIRTN